MATTATTQRQQSRAVPKTEPRPRRAPLAPVRPGADKRRSARRNGRGAFVLGSFLIVGSLIGATAGHAYLVQGQVKLASQQQAVDDKLVWHRYLELLVAQLESPSSVVSQAQGQGLVSPTQVGDLPQVNADQAPGSTHPAGAAVSPTPASAAASDPAAASGSGASSVSTSLTQSSSAGTVTSQSSVTSTTVSSAGQVSQSTGGQ